MAILGNTRRQARVTVVLAAAAVAAPSLVQAVTRIRIGSQEILAVEFAGSGERLLDLAQGDQQRLEAYRSVLGVRDNAYVVAYTLPLLLGADLLPGSARLIAGAVVGGTAAADVVENLALESALEALQADPTRPEQADHAARRARRAAAVKFGLLGPAVGLALWGAVRGWRSIGRH